MALLKLNHHFDSLTIIEVIFHPLKNMLKKLEVLGRLAHIMIELGDYDIKYMPRSYVKSQALAYFVGKFINSPRVNHNEGGLKFYNTSIEKV